MIIIFGVLLLAWVGVFVFLWDWALNNIDKWWGGLIPVGWFVLAPCIFVQSVVWWG